MRLITFSPTGDAEQLRLGVLDGESITDISAIAGGDMNAFLAAGDEAMQAAYKASASARGSDYALGDVQLHSPVAAPPRIFAVGLNYADHLAELQEAAPQFPTPQVPIIFNKQTTSVNGPYNAIYLPPESEQMDYEGELAIVIGKRCRRVPEARAWEVVAGSMVSNDVTIRDWQQQAPTMTMGKSWDSHCPMGPALVTTDEVDPAALDFEVTVNGEQRQSSNTRELLFGIPHLVAYLSTAFTLLPGDVVLTGTTSGVARWMPGQPWLKEGDLVRVQIEGLGHIENRVEKDPVGTSIG